MNIGYACQTLGVRDASFRTCRASTCTPELLDGIIAHNLQVLGNILAWNARFGIRMFRITSDLIPFGSSPVNTLPWRKTHKDAFLLLGEQIRQSGMRVSMHPGQYTLLNAQEPDIVHRAVADLSYHADVLEALGTASDAKLVLHVGGVYGDRSASLARFRSVWRDLDDRIKSRLVIENDERCFPIGDVLELGHALGIPVVYDNLHNRLLPTDTSRSDAAWMEDCRPTWKPADGRQKIHYAQQAAGRRPGSHADTIRIGEFLSFVDALPDVKPDIMLEVKDKNLSARKCQLCVSERTTMRDLETEWARWKYRVLEASPAVYQAIRLLLKDKTAVPAVAFYALIEQAQDAPIDPGHAENAAQHVWGYFRGKADDRAKAAFNRALEKFRAGTGSLSAVKGVLQRLAVAHKENYLLDSLYFDG